MSDSVVPLWFHFTSLFGVMLLASYLCGKRLAKTISLADAMLKAEREKAIPVAASLAAAISLLERGGKNAAPSDRMFEQMLKDYRGSLDDFRALISEDATDG